jgi:hypothetical protein
MICRTRHVLALKLAKFIQPFMRVRSVAAAAAGVVLLGAASGCSVLSLLYGDAPDAPLEAPRATSGQTAPWKLELGSGELGFAPLAEGGLVEKIEGPQGGYHFWVSVRVTGTVPTALEIEIEVDADGAVVSRSSSVVPMTPESPASAVSTASGLRAFVEKGTSGPVRLLVKAIDPSTRASVDAQRQVVLE